MKILQINNVYGEKSTGKITKIIHEALLKAGHDSLVVYGRGRGCEGPGVVRLCPDWYGKANNVLSRFTGMPYGGCLLSTSRLIRLIRKERPDVVHLQCINGYFVNIYRLVDWLKKQGIPTVVSLHAEFMYTANCGHAFECDQWKHGCKRCPDKRRATKSVFFDRTGSSWRRMQAAFRGFEERCVISPVSPWTEARARQSDIMAGFRFQTVYNAVDDAVFYLMPELEKESYVFHVTAQFTPQPDHPKGGWYLVELAKRMPEVTFLVAGRAGECDELPDNVKLLGEVKDQARLAELYNRARLSLVVSRRETYSMPCAESLCCGTPVVGFKAGAPEQIALPEYSQFVEFGDLDALESVVRDWLGRERLDQGEIAEAARKAYSVETMVGEFVRIYGEML